MEKREKKRKTQTQQACHSTVNKYELLCLEKSSESFEPDEERILLAFEALNDLIPNLGVYSPILKQLYSDFHAAVYSDELTAHGEAIQKIPYFTLIQRVYDERNYNLETVNEQLEIVKRRLFDKHKQYEEMQEKKYESDDCISEMQQTVGELERTIAERDEEIENLKKEVNDKREQAEHMEQDLQREIDVLNELLNEAKEEMEGLSKYKKGYDNLYNAFTDTGEIDDIAPRRKKPVLYGKKVNLINNVDAAKKLEGQIVTVLNAAVDEFEKFLESHRLQLEQFDTKDEMTETEMEVAELDLDQVDQQLEAEQLRFRDSVANITHELDLLKRHNDMLMEQLQDIEQKDHSLGQRSRNQMTDPQGLSKSDSVLSAGLEGDEEEDTEDPFIPQERVFSKYAALIYISHNEGKSFEEFKESKYCGSCGEKTSICPHKLAQGEKIFSLPLNPTHIKIARPKVRINKELINDILNPRSPESTFDSLAISQSVLDGYASQTPVTSGDAQSAVDSEENILTYTAQRMFDDFKDRTQTDRTAPRQMTLERMMSVTEQLWAYIIWYDENYDNTRSQSSITDCVYDFMVDRYLIKDVSELCVYDYLYAVLEYSGENKTIQLLLHVLTGNLDGACFRYLMLMCDFICAVEWTEVEDFRGFAAAVYSFLSEDDLESLQMSYTSFSENKISPQLVAHFLIHIILKNREPYFQEMEHRLHPFQTDESLKPVLTEGEFREAVDSILPVVNGKLLDRLYKQCASQNMDSTHGMPVRRLAQVVSYMSLLQISHVIKDTVAAKVLEWRERPSSSGEGKVLHQSQLTESFEPLLSLSSAKQLAVIIARRSKHRQERLEAPNW